MSDHGSDTEAKVEATAASVQDGGATAPASGGVDVEKLLAKVAALEADNKGYRDQLRAIKAASDEKAKKAVEFDAVLRERDDEIAKIKSILSEYEPIVEAHRENAKRREAKIAEAAKALSDEDRALVEAIADVDKREALIARLLGEKKADAAAVATKAEKLPSAVVRVNGQATNKAFSLF